MIKKQLRDLFINAGTSAEPNWTRIKKSTELTIALNPETEEVDYIADENPTTELTKYAPSIEHKAWKGSAIVSCNELNAVDSEISFDLAFGGTVDRGTATVVSGTPTFTSGATE